LELGSSFIPAAAAAEFRAGFPAVDSAAAGLPEVVEQAERPAVAAWPVAQKVVQLAFPWAVERD
jgi:hypothetical protein